MKYNVQIVFGNDYCTEPVIVEATEFQAQDLCYMTEAALEALPTHEAERVHDVKDTFVSPVPAPRMERNPSNDPTAPRLVVVR